MRSFFLLIWLSLAVYGLADGEISNVRSIKIKGAVIAYLTVNSTTDKSIFIQSPHGTLQIVPGNNSQIAVIGKSIVPFRIHLTHFATTEFKILKTVEAVGSVGIFYANNNTQLSYQDNKGAFYASEGNARLQPVQSGQNLKLSYHGNLTFKEITKEEMDQR